MDCNNYYYNPFQTIIIVAWKVGVFCSANDDSIKFNVLPQSWTLKLTDLMAQFSIVISYCSFSLS